MPKYKDGGEHLKNTIQKNLKWPGKMCCIEGTVYVSFIVEPSGQLTNRRIVRGISSQKPCDADGEAVRVLDFLNECIPGECNGEKVSVEIAIPIKFSLM